MEYIKLTLKDISNAVREQSGCHKCLNCKTVGEMFICEKRDIAHPEEETDWMSNGADCRWFSLDCGDDSTTLGEIYFQQEGED